MKLSYLPSEFQKALPILEKIKAAGFEAYFVGGSVRDALLNRPIHDVDIASSSYPEETKQIFERTVDIGIEHGTILVLENGGEYEVTTFRTEDVYVDYRRPSSVSFVRSLEEDLKRRDFTVNAFALNENAEIIDKFDGLTDLDNHVLRAVGKAEVEDSAAETDMNVVMTEDGRIIEVQGTAEGEPFTHEELLTLLALARGGIESIVATQKAALAN